MMHMHACSQVNITSYLTAGQLGQGHRLRWCSQNVHCGIGWSHRAAVTRVAAQIQAYRCVSSSSMLRVVLVLTVLHAAGVGVFLSGFLLTRSSLHDVSECPVPPSPTDHDQRVSDAGPVLESHPINVTAGYVLLNLHVGRIVGSCGLLLVCVSHLPSQLRQIKHSEEQRLTYSDSSINTSINTHIIKFINVYCPIPGAILWQSHASTELCLWSLTPFGTTWWSGSTDYRQS